MKLLTDKRAKFLNTRKQCRLSVCCYCCCRSLS